MEQRQNDDQQRRTKKTQDTFSAVPHCPRFRRLKPACEMQSHNSDDNRHFEALQEAIKSSLTFTKSVVLHIVADSYRTVQRQKNFCSSVVPVHLQIVITFSENISEYMAGYRNIFRKVMCQILLTYQSCVWPNPFLK